jgi:dolichol-phosphate mannosyltransferase
MDKKIAIAVVIPAFKAAGKISNVIEHIPDFVSFIIVVDDASPDNTSEIVKRLTGKDSRIKVVSHSANQGIGGAVLSGYQLAQKLKAEIIVKIDSDGQMDPAYILPLITPILNGKADYTKGNRFLHTTELSTMPLVRRIGNLALSFLTKFATGYWNVFDPTNGYTAIHTQTLTFLNLNRIDQRYFYETSMLIELGLQRAVVRDIYMPCIYNDENSTLSEFQALYQFPPKLLQGLLRRLLIQYYIRDFSTLSILLIIGPVMTLFGTGWGAYHWWRSINTGIVATSGTVMIAVLSLILGIQFILEALVMDIQNVPGDAISFPSENVDVEAMLRLHKDA